MNGTRSAARGVDRVPSFEGDEVLTRAQERAVEEKLRDTWREGQMALEGLEEATTDVLGVSSEIGAPQGVSQDPTNISL